MKNTAITGIAKTIKKVRSTNLNSVLKDKRLAKIKNFICHLGSSDIIVHLL